MCTLSQILKLMFLLQALVNNPKIEVVDGKYAFKPKYNLKDKKALLRLLDKHDQRGLGGILLEDIEEGLPNAQKAIKVSEPALLRFSERTRRLRENFVTSYFCSLDNSKPISEGQIL